MIRTIKLPALFLLLTTVALSITGCAGKKASPVELEMDAFDRLRSNVQNVVVDPTRADQSLKLVAELQRVFDDIKALRVERRERIKALNADYDAPRSEFESLLDDITQERIANQERVSQTYRELLEVITTEEWTQLAKARDKALQNAINALEPI